MARRLRFRPRRAAPLDAKGKFYLAGYRAGVAGEPPDALRQRVSAHYAAGYEHGREERK